MHANLYRLVTSPVPETNTKTKKKKAVIDVSYLSHLTSEEEDGEHAAAEHVGYSCLLVTSITSVIVLVPVVAI